MSLNDYESRYYICDKCSTTHIAFKDGSFLTTTEIVIEDISSLTTKQINHILRANSKQLNCRGRDYKVGGRLSKVWIDDDGTTCGRCQNGEWYHYYKDGTWG